MKLDQSLKTKNGSKKVATQTVCFNDYQDLMVAARIGRNGSVRQIAGCGTDPSDTRHRFVSCAIFEIVWGTTLNRHTGEEEALTRGRMSMHRVCVYPVGQNHVSRSAALGGEIIATMCWECIYYQVDVMTGDGNKAAYLSTPKNPGCHTFEVSLLQYWIDRMFNTATQSRIKHYGPSPPVRANTLSLVLTMIWYISVIISKASRLKRTLQNLHTRLMLMGTCMLTLLEWGHARNDFTEDVNVFDDEEHMSHVGEFVFQVNDTCLSRDNRKFWVSPNDKDSHNPILIHIAPADMTHYERRTYVPAELKQARKERRKEKQKANKRKSYEPSDDGGDEGYYGQYSASSSS